MISVWMVTQWMKSKIPNHKNHPRNLLKRKQKMILKKIILKRRCKVIVQMKNLKMNQIKNQLRRKNQKRLKSKLLRKINKNRKKWQKNKRKKRRQKKVILMRTKKSLTWEM